MGNIVIRRLNPHIGRSSSAGPTSHSSTITLAGVNYSAGASGLFTIPEESLALAQELGLVGHPTALNGDQIATLLKDDLLAPGESVLNTHTGIPVWISADGDDVVTVAGVVLDFAKAAVVTNPADAANLNDNAELEFVFDALMDHATITTSSLHVYDVDDEADVVITSCTSVDTTVTTTSIKMAGDWPIGHVLIARADATIKNVNGVSIDAFQLVTGVTCVAH